MSLALTLDKATGKLHCSDPETLITYNDPWPLKFAKAGVTGKMQGVVLHTMVASLDSCINTFNSPGAKGSAHIGISQKGRIHQFVPIGKGYETFHAFAANMTRYGIETEDFGKPSTPIADPALTAWAQCFEFLSRFAGFALQVTDDCHGQGLAYHRMCPEWNLSVHSCPGSSFTDFVRVNQRAEIVHRAHLIRNPVPVPPTTPVEIHADGHTTWGQLAGRYGLHPRHLVWQTAAHTPQGFGPLEGNEMDKLADQVIAAGTVIWAGKYPA